MIKDDTASNYEHLNHTAGCCVDEEETLMSKVWWNDVTEMMSRRWRHGDDVMEMTSRRWRHRDDVMEMTSRRRRHGDDVTEMRSRRWRHGDDVKEMTSRRWRHGKMTSWRSSIQSTSDDWNWTKSKAALFCDQNNLNILKTCFFMFFFWLSLCFHSWSWVSMCKLKDMWLYITVALQYMWTNSN